MTATVGVFNWWFQCGSKIRYRKKDAKRALKSIQTWPGEGTRKDDRRLHVYRCPHCNGWHVGHQVPGEVLGETDSVETG